MTVEIEYSQDIDLPQWLLDRVDGDELLARLLIQRGVDTKKEVEQFLNPASYQPSEPADFPGLEEAADLILRAASREDSICVYGDYDADGVTSTAILVTMLEAVTSAVEYHIPDRFSEGYGLDKGVIKDLAQQGIDLIITCDCGISNHEEVSLAKELGLDIIVTDHHDLPEKLPHSADAIVSPKLLDQDHQAYHLPGAGISYFLAQEVLIREGQDKLAASLIDLAALAIVADVVRLRGENRYLLQKGLKSLAATNWDGVAELCRRAGVELFQISEVDIGFRLGPRLNAAGRIDKGDIAVELLLSQEEERAKFLAEKLDEINEERKEIGKQMKEEALTLTSENEGKRAIVLYQPHWHQGVVGITAGRLAEKFNVPVLLLCDKRDEEGVITGSARSIEGINIRASLAECKEQLISFGGHAGAAGCSLDRGDWPDFKDCLEDLLNKELEELGEERKIKVDDKLNLAETDLDLYEKLRRLAPFGEGNPKPLFYDTDLEVANYRSLNTEDNFKLTLSDGKVQRTALWWGGNKDQLADGIDLVYTLEANTWQGQRKLQLEVKEIIKETEELDVERELDCELVDWRNWYQRGREFPNFADALYYYEGTKEDWPVEVINRYTAQTSEDLVLLSCPPDLKIIKDLLYTVQPRRLIL
ncbi:MAG: single-stranded-DNA-specific exonuclease RecJ, partial [Halanaerobacter sp.]